MDGGVDQGTLFGADEKPKLATGNTPASKMNVQDNLAMDSPEAGARFRAQEKSKAQAISKTPSGFDPDDDRTVDSPEPETHFGDEDLGNLSPAARSPARNRSSSRQNISGGLKAGMDFGPRFRIEKLLGEGGMGKVYKAFDKELGRTVALKILQPELTKDPNITQRFKQELLLASKISHKNILRIHDLNEFDGVKYITMAFIEGQDLHQLLKEVQPFPLERSVKIARQLCDALDAAHAEGVVHRDFKPHNVLVGKNDHVYVSDFGLATSLESAKMGMTRTGAFVGTPRYMSPEQVEGKLVDHRSDLYSLGLVLYEMLAGEVPFAGDSAWQVMYQRVKEKPKDVKLVNPGVPDSVARIVMHCLEKEPADRYQHAKEILADLDAGRSPTVSHSASRSVQISLPLGEYSWMYAVGGGVILLAGLFFAIPATRHLVFPGSPRGATSVTENGLPPLSQGKFVAVLPFRVLGDQASLGYVADGLGEALSAKLFQLKEVRVSSAAATAKADPKSPLPQVAKDLGVNMIVHGTVQGSGAQLRITVNLENVAENRLVWSQEFSGVSGDLLTMEDQIYGRLTDALESKPTGAEMAAAHPTENVDAYDLYLHGRNALRNSQEKKNVETAIDFFYRALKKDSSFALAYTGLADASLIMYHESKDSFWAQKALAAAQQAERLNDTLPEAHYSLGSVYNMTGKTAESIAQIKRALELAPNSDEGYRRLGTAYLANNQKDEAIAAYKKALEVNAYYWTNQNDIGTAYFQLGQYGNALAAFQRVVELEPNNVFGYLNIGAVYLQQGKYSECIPMFQKALQIEPRFDIYSNLGTANFYLQNYPEAVKMFEKAVEMNPNQETVVGNLADGYRWSGQKEKAQSTYDKAIALAFKELAVNPRQANTMGSLALYYAKKGDKTRALEFIHRARKIDSADVSLIYTQAVVENIAGQSAAAMQSLRTAFQKGYPAEDASGDPELDNLKSHSDFQALLKEFHQKKS
jgi:serine/threonine protein kinase/tetratricopeptide (TPR) repeat protein/TolB-like protein